MLVDNNLRLSVLHKDNLTFVDLSEKAVNFRADTISLTLHSTEDIFYIGYRKPFNTVYFFVSTLNSITSTFSMEYYDGTDWIAMATFRDLTSAWTKSGWMSWDKPTDWTANEINSIEKYWVRIVCSTTLAATSMQGINLVFSDDQELSTEFPAITNTAFIQQGETTHIKSHVAARNQMIQDLRNQGYIKQDIEGNWKQITPWDLHDISEVQQAAMFLALSKIFFNVSDNPTDNWMFKSKWYGEKYGEAIKQVMLSLDLNDDGTSDKAEQRTSNVKRMSR